MTQHAELVERLRTARSLTDAESVRMRREAADLIEELEYEVRDARKRSRFNARLADSRLRECEELKLELEAVSRMNGRE